MEAILPADTGALDSHSHLAGLQLRAALRNILLTRQRIRYPKVMVRIGVDTDIRLLGSYCRTRTR